MVVILVFCEHSGNIMHVKTHIDLKGRGYIPRAVVLMLCIWSNFLAKISNVMNTCQNDRLEGWTFVANQIIASELRQKVQKHLIIASTVYLIDHQHDLLIIQFADNTKLTEQLHQICNRSQLSLRNFHQCSFVRKHRSFHKSVNESLGKSFFILKCCNTHLCLKIHRNYCIVISQIALQCIQKCSFPILPSSIDTEVLPLIHHIFDSCKAAVQIDHVMLLRITASGDVEIPFHMFHLVFVCRFLLLLLYHIARAITTII